MNTPPWTFRGARRRLSLLALCAPLLLAAPFSFDVAAQSAAPVPVTLRQAVDAALARLPETQSAAQRREAVQARSRSAGHWTPEPAALELSLKSDRLQANRGDRELVAGISAPLWLPGERARTQALAQAEQGAIEARLAAVHWRAVAAVREAWWAAHAARQVVALAQARQAHAEQLAGDVGRRVRAGESSRADQHQADGAVAAAGAERASAQAAQARALQRLQALTGLPGATELAIEAEPPAPDTGTGLPPHPLLRDLADRAEVARRTRELAGTQTRANPALTLATTRERGAFGEGSVQSLTLGLRIPFGSDDRQAAKLASAAAEQTEAEVQLALERDRVAGDIEAARAELAAARTAAESSALRAALARETRGFYEKSFRLGETDLPNRLRIDLEDFEAERQQARDRIALAAAGSQLRQALGLLPE